jgi:light-regulated signal transduction histidine kinase (bacteriophytochrome)
LPDSFDLATPLDACAREPIHIPGSASVASGMAAARLPLGWLLWLRRINPRKSFQTWLEDVRGQSRPWEQWACAAVTEAGQLVTRLTFADQESIRQKLEYRTNLLLSERASELERLTTEAEVAASETTAPS